MQKKAVKEEQNNKQDMKTYRKYSNIADIYSTTSIPILNVSIND